MSQNYTIEQQDTILIVVFLNKQNRGIVPSKKSVVMEIVCLGGEGGHTHVKKMDTIDLLNQYSISHILWQERIQLKNQFSSGAHEQYKCF